MTVRVSTVIMADPRREDMVDQLLARLDAPARVVWDDGSRNRWETGKRALRACLDDPDATHGLVIQDDAIPCRDLVAAATVALATVPDEAVSFYAGRPRPQDTRLNIIMRDARDSCATWFRWVGPWWGVCVALPTYLIAPVIEAADTFRKVANYDVRVMRGLLELGKECLYSLPSLVDHRQGHPSLIPGGRPQGRRAWWFVGEHASGLDVPWHRPILDS